MSRRLAIALALLAVGAAGCGGGSPSAQQRVLDGVVKDGIAPGATAYVAGPHGTWSGGRARRTSSPARGCSPTSDCGSRATARRG